MGKKTIRLNDTICKQMTTTKTQEQFSDDRQDGLAIRVSKAGAKHWGLSKWVDGKARWIPLGRFQAKPGDQPADVETTRSDAVKAAKIKLAEIANGALSFEDRKNQPLQVPTLKDAFELHCKINPKGNEQETIRYHRYRFENYVQDFMVKVDGVASPLGSVTLDKIENYHLDDLKADVLKKFHKEANAKAMTRHKKAVAKWKTGGRVGEKPEVEGVPDHTGARTVNMVLNRLTTVFLFAIRRKVVPAGWVKPKADEIAQEAGVDDTNHIPRHQAAAFYSAVELLRQRKGYKPENNDTIADLILACLWCGGRKGNVMAMQWSQLDLGEGVWRIPRDIYKSRKKMKTSHKVIALPSHLIQLLKNRKGLHKKWVFSAWGTDDHIQDFRKSWAWVKKEAGITHRVTIHGLRHSLGTWLHQAGAPLKAIAGQLGQSDLSSAERYAANDPKHLQSLTGNVVDASFEVVDDDAPPLVLTQDEWRQVLTAVGPETDLGKKVKAVVGS